MRPTMHQHHHSNIPSPKTKTNYKTIDKTPLKYYHIIIYMTLTNA